MSKKWFRLTTAALFLACILPVLPASAAGKTVKVSGSAGSEEIQAALDQGLEATAESPLTVVVAAGKHKLDKRLYIFSNTTLHLEPGAEMIAEMTEATNGSNGKNGAMLYGKHLTEYGAVCHEEEKCKHGGYTQIQNITVEGGVWNRRCDVDSTLTASVMNLRHGTNITIQNLEVKNCTSHFINISGVDGAVVSNVTFRNQPTYTGTDPEFTEGDYEGERQDACEVLHIDYITAKSERKAYPYDNTICKNITVKNCTFDSIYAGVGTHHSLGLYSENITISGNQFNKVKAHCIDSYNYRNLTVSGNKAEGNSAQFFIDAEKSTGTVSDNTYSNGFMFLQLKGKEEKGVSGSSFTVTGNTVSGIKEHAIYLKDKSTATIEKNTITDSSKMAVYLVGGSSAVLKENTLKGSGDHLVSVEKSVITADGNTLDTAATHGFRLYSVLDGCTVANNTVSNVEESGIFLDGCTGKVQISNNTVSGVGKSGVRIRNKCNAQVSGNTITGPKEAGICVTDSAVVTAKNNTIRDSASNGIYLSGAGAKYVIEGNKVTGSKNMGVMVNASGKSGKIRKNTVESSGRIGIYVKSTASSTISDNTVKKSKSIGIETEGTKGKTCSGTIKNNVITTLKSGKRDIYLGAYSKGITLDGNKMSSLGFGAHDSATWKDLDGSGSADAVGAETFSAGGVNYQVLKKKTVMVTGGNSTTMTKVKIPATVKRGGVTYKVVSVKNNAFRNYKKLTSVEIGKNVTTMGYKIFEGCKSLKKIVFRGDSMESVGGKTFKGIHAKAKIYVPKDAVELYQKKLKGKGQGGGVKIAGR